MKAHIEPGRVVTIAEKRGRLLCFSMRLVVSLLFACLRALMSSHHAYHPGWCTSLADKISPTAAQSRSPKRLPKRYSLAEMRPTEAITIRNTGQTRAVSAEEYYGTSYAQPRPYWCTVCCKAERGKNSYSPKEFGYHRFQSSQITFSGARLVPRGANRCGRMWCYFPGHFSLCGDSREQQAVTDNLFAFGN